MNDRFRFRAWNKEEKRMYYDAQDTYDYMTGDPIIFAESFGCLLTNDEEWEVEQCTGLKDKNGKLIYEGDILDCELHDIDSHGYPFIHFKKGVVKRAKNGAYCVEGDDDFYASDITLYSIEIIGNIHEQAEQKD